MRKLFAWLLTGISTTARIAPEFPADNTRLLNSTEFYTVSNCPMESERMFVSEAVSKECRPMPNCVGRSKAASPIHLTRLYGIAKTMMEKTTRLFIREIFMPCGFEMSICAACWPA